MAAMSDELEVEALKDRAMEVEVMNDDGGLMIPNMPF